MGAAVEWVRRQPHSTNWIWASDIIVVLLAAWAAGSLLALWPGLSTRRLPGLLAVMLAVVLLGAVIMHEL